MTLRLSDLTFLSRAEQDAAFKSINDNIGSLLIRGHMTREGHRTLLEMTRLLADAWFTQQSDDAGARITLERPLP